MTSLISSLALSLLNGGNSEVSQDFIIVRLSLWLNKNLCKSGLCIGGKFQMFVLCYSGCGSADCYQSSV